MLPISLHTICWCDSYSDYFSDVTMENTAITKKNIETMETEQQRDLENETEIINTEIIDDSVTTTISNTTISNTTILTNTVRICFVAQEVFIPNN